MKSHLRESVSSPSFRGVIRKFFIQDGNRCDVERDRDNRVEKRDDLLESGVVERRAGGEIETAPDEGNEENGDQIHHQRSAV